MEFCKRSESRVLDQPHPAAGWNQCHCLLAVTFSQWVQCVNHQLEDGVPQRGVVKRRRAATSLQGRPHLQDNSAAHIHCCCDCNRSTTQLITFADFCRRMNQGTLDKRKRLRVSRSEMGFGYSFLHPESRSVLLWLRWRFVVLGAARRWLGFNSGLISSLWCSGRRRRRSRWG